MPAGNKTKKESFKSDSLDGALLFLLLSKRIGGHPDDFSAAEIQQNPLCGFEKYSANTFKRSAQTVANRVKKFEEKGTGLTKQFKELLKQAFDKHSELFDNEEEDDEDYTFQEDLDEVSLSDQLQDPRFDASTDSASNQPPIDTSNVLSNSRRSQAKKAPEKKKVLEKKATTKAPKEPPIATKPMATNNSPNNIPGVKSLTKCCDGRCCGRMTLSSDFNDATRFYVSLCGTKVMSKTPAIGDNHPMNNECKDLLPETWLCR